jgi:hypothetical protein
MVRDFIIEAQAQKPPVSHVDLDFFDGLSHAPDAEQILDEDDFE